MNERTRARMDAKARQRNLIAWKLLIRDAGERKHREVTPERFHHQWVKYLPQLREVFDYSVQDSLWEFAADLVDAVGFASRKSEDTGTEYQLPEDRRLELSYPLVILLFYTDSIRIGPNFRREMHTRASEIKIDPKAMESFLTEAVRDVLRLALVPHDSEVDR